MDDAETMALGNTDSSLFMVITILKTTKTIQIWTLWYLSLHRCSPHFLFFSLYHNRLLSVYLETTEGIPTSVSVQLRVTGDVCVHEFQTPDEVSAWHVWYVPPGWIQSLLSTDNECSIMCFVLRKRRDAGQWGSLWHWEAVCLYMDVLYYLLKAVLGTQLMQFM